ncbi:cathepsin L1 isoform X3 [Nasonia vitripennis]|uniref:Uncharacterized protein n=1 Tax=Nasonia vitripennis TaxID=7425 RepID=A0A7M7IY29_NASVI|nr:cathepsin L1 isoform X3 [Nasonia vitripennis]
MYNSCIHLSLHGHWTRFSEYRERMSYMCAGLVRTIAMRLRYKKNYNGDVEENFRRSVFHENQRKIAEHNQKHDLGLFTYKVRINQFGDMMFEEYKNYMHAANNTITQLKRIPRGDEFIKPKSAENVPEHVDWRQRGAVTPVRDQGLTCGSCWAFSAAGALEAQYFKKTGVLTALSAQNLIDCTMEYGNLGCGGGSAALSFQFVVDQKGLEPEANYSYEGRTKECPYNTSDDEDEELDASFIYVNGGDEATLKVAVATVGPFSAAIDGSHDTFRFYSEGVYYQPECNEDDLDHAVLIVGYGTDNRTDQDFWLVKNSWGETWGEGGYFKVARNRRNHCGIAAAAVYPVI